MPPLLHAAVHGDTALHLAIRLHEPDLAQCLIDRGASLYVENAVGESPVSMLWDQKMKNPGQAYDALFSLIAAPLQRYHADLRLKVLDAITKIYQEHCPTRIPKIEMQMQQYEGRENELLTLIQRKYLD